jgi:purine-binding chemotaxis protein CheW
MIDNDKTKERINENLQALYEDDEGEFQQNKHLTFDIDNRKYGIEIKNINEILEIQKITEVPDMPKYVKGVINLRGKIIPVIDFRARLKLPDKEYNDRTCIIILNIDDIVVGLIVDTVSEVLSIPEKNLSDPPDFKDNAQYQGFVKKIGKTEDAVVVILDLYKLIYDERFKKENL